MKPHLKALSVHLLKSGLPHRVCWYDDLLAAGELKVHDTVGGVELF